MEYYSAIKKNEIMPFSAIWMDLEIITVVENRLMVAKEEEVWRRGGLGVWDEQMQTIIHIGWINNRSYCIAQGTMFNIL